jgi:peptidoglycan hydrolase-like protein with peptidoglycan-binding domain
MSTTKPEPAPARATRVEVPWSLRQASSRRTRALAAVAVLLVAAIVVVVLDPFAGAARSTNVRDNSYATGLVSVRRGPLSSQVTGVGTLGYSAGPGGSPYGIVNQASGHLTALPTIGQVIAEGQVLYRVDNHPVVLLDGATPAYRSLSQGDRGPDVRELNADLVALGLASRQQIDNSSDYFSPATATALARLQARLGVEQTGTLPFGEAVFLPGPIRITDLTATLGTSAPLDTAIAHATSTRRQVQVNIDATEQSSLAAGDRVLITLPNYQDTAGVVTQVGTVANGSGSTSPTIPVTISLLNPRSAGSLDQAPVRVQITSAGVSNALIVPVTALLAQNGGGYAVETVDAHAIHHLVPVTLGLFDDADGLVQVSGDLHPGQQVVVPAT